MTRPVKTGAGFPGTSLIACFLLASAPAAQGQDAPAEKGRSSQRGGESEWMPALDVAGLPESIRRDLDAAREQIRSAPSDAGPAGELGAILFGSQLHDAAAACFERAAALDREPARWLYYLGLCQRKAQRIPAAIAAFERALASAPAYAPLHVALGELLLESDPERAAQLFRRAVELDPDLAVAHAALGRWAAMQGRDEEALGHFRRAVELEPAFGAAHYELAMLLRAAGKPDEAAGELRRFEAGSPPPTRGDPWREALDRMARSPLSTLTTVSTLWKAGRNEEARALLETELENRPEHEGLRDLLGEAYLRLESFDKAAEQFRRVLEINPRSVEVKSKLAFALSSLGRYEEAEAILRAALVERPDSGIVLQQLARVSLRQGHVEEALSLFRRAVSAQPGDAELRIELARALAKAGRRLRAIEQVRIALEISPGSAWGHMLLGGLLEQTGEQAEAEEHWEAALAADPSLEQAYLGLSASAARSGDYGRARRQLERGLSKLPQSPALMSRLAWVLATSPSPALRDGPRSLELAEKACAAAPADAPEYQDALAAAMAEVGRYADAVQAEERAIEAGTRGERKDLVRSFRQRLALYAAGRPYREPPR